MTQHYIFFTGNALPQPRADLVQVTNCANAAANLGYSTVLTYLKAQSNSNNPIDWLFPFQPKMPDQELARFYNIQSELQVASLPVPKLIDQASKKWKWANSSSLVCKYYFPLYIRPAAKIVHTRSWNFVKAAVKSGVPAIYEHHHHERKQFEPEIVHHPLFQIAVTVADTVRASMIESGMPPEKVVKLHNGFNQLFLTRQTQQAAAWRQKLVTGESQRLVIYSGALQKFKGIDLLMDAAKALPQVQVAFAGGSEPQVKSYQELSREKQIENVTFLGHLPHEQLASLLQAADVLAHPHCSGEAATFTSPLKFFDYMAAGVPIVATEIPSLMEFKPSGVVAGWCEPDDPMQLAHCIQQVLETHPRKPEGYSNSIDFVRQFSWENRITRIMSYVEDSMRPC